MGIELASIIINAIVTLVGIFGGILTANKLMAYRIEQLEKKVDKHNNTIERTYLLEQKVEYIEDDIDDLKKQLDK